MSLAVRSSSSSPWILPSEMEVEPSSSSSSVSSSSRNKRLKVEPPITNSDCLQLAQKEESFDAVTAAMMTADISRFDFDQSVQFASSNHEVLFSFQSYPYKRVKDIVLPKLKARKRDHFRKILHKVYLISLAQSPHLMSLAEEFEKTPNRAFEDRLYKFVPPALQRAKSLLQKYHSSQDNRNVLYLTIQSFLKSLLHIQSLIAFSDDDIRKRLMDLSDHAKTGIWPKYPHMQKDFREISRKIRNNKPLKDLREKKRHLTICLNQLSRDLRKTSKKRSFSEHPTSRENFALAHAPALWHAVFIIFQKFLLAASEDPILQAKLKSDELKQLSFSVGTLTLDVICKIWDEIFDEFSMDDFIQHWLAKCREVLFEEGEASLLASLRQIDLETASLLKALSSDDQRKQIKEDAKKQKAQIILQKCPIANFQSFQDLDQWIQS